MISCEDLTLSLGGRQLLSGIDLRVQPGRTMGLIGPNGAGKSTLLTSLAGLVAPTSGRVSVVGLDPRRASELELARVRALLPQSSSSTLEVSVRELVMMGRAPHVVAETASCHEIVEGVLAQVGLRDRADDALASLSGGERQRAHLARVLTQLSGRGCAALLLDEPVSAQDPAWQLMILSLLREVAARGVAVLVVLHDLNLAARFCSDLTLLSQGRVLARGAPREVLTSAALRQAYGVDVVVDDDPFEPGRPRVAFGMPRDPGSAPGQEPVPRAPGMS